MGQYFKYIIIKTHETFWNEYINYIVFKKIYKTL